MYQEKIYSEYTHLLNNSSVFYKTKAFKTKLTTHELKIEIPALKEIFLGGGLSFKTPKKGKKLSNKIFAFYKDIDTLTVKEKFSILLNIEDNHNIKTTSTLYYKNIAIAEVKKVSLDSHIIIKIEGDKKYKYLFGRNAKIYLKGVKISLNSIENLSSTILGDNLYLIADKNNGFKSSYKLDSINPDDTHYKKGLRVQLKAKESHNIAVDSPIYYKGFEVGKIYDADLTKDGKFIIFDLFIEEKYKHILKQNSKFYKGYHH